VQTVNPTCPHEAVTSVMVPVEVVTTAPERSWYHADTVSFALRLRLVEQTKSWKSSRPVQPSTTST